MQKTEFPIRTQRETERLIESIRETYNPNAIILFGEYVNGIMRNTRGGYELLILTDKDFPHTGEEIHEHLAVDVKRGNRYEKKLTLYLYRSDMFITEISSNYFFYMIHKEGHLFYTDGSLPLDKAFTLHATRFADRIAFHTETYLAQANSYLSVSHESLKQLSMKTASINLFLAMELYLFAMEYSYFGFRQQQASYYNLIMWIKHTSRPFLEWTTTHKPQINHSIKKLEKMYSHARNSFDFSYSPENVIECYDLISDMKTIIENECKNRIEFYKSLKPEKFRKK